MYTQFCLHYREYAQQTKATMHLDHKPGEQMEVDWAGDTAKVTDPETGSQTPAYLFIAVLSCSGYAYAERKSVTEIARLEGVTKASVSLSLARAIKKISKKFAAGLKNS